MDVNDPLFTSASDLDLEESGRARRPRRADRLLRVSAPLKTPR